MTFRDLDEIDDLLGKGDKLPDQTPTDATLTFEAEVKYETDLIRDLLIEKNRQYGDSALNPLRVFSSADPTATIEVRIDDKLSRLARGNGAGDEDVVLDLIGYLVLLRVSQKRDRAEKLLNDPDNYPF